MFFKRSYSPEIMDDFTIHGSRIDQALNELRIINKYLGGNSSSLSGLNILAPNSKFISVLDLGGGASDILKELKHKQNLKITSLDINIKVCTYTKNNSPDITPLCSNAISPPFRIGSFEIIHASLFMHHFKEEQIILMLKKYLEICTLGIIINDLRRNIFAYAGIKTLTSIFSKSSMVKNDGPLSVKRGFIKSDLEEILKDAGINHYMIKRKWAFRWLVVIPKQ